MPATEPPTPLLCDCMAPNTDPTVKALAAVTDALAVVLRRCSEQAGRISAELTAEALRAAGVTPGDLD